MSTSDPAAPVLSHATPQTTTGSARRAVFSGSLGSALEYFDFSVYGTLAATVFPKVFFSELNTGTALLASFATFGAGFFARPLGGLVFGAVGDRLGRRTVLIVTLVLMGVSSSLIGVLPSYATAGLLAPTLLVLLRFVQGFALGGEVTGSQLLALEHAPDHRRGFFGSLMAIGSPIAQVFATLTLTGLAFVLSPEQFLSWGWRIPFIFGIVMVVVGYYVRRNVDETPVFAEAEQLRAAEKIPQERALAVFRKRPGTVIALICAWAAPAALFWVCVTFAISYLTGTLKYPNSISFGMLVIANFASIFAALLGGRLSDRIGRRKVFATGLVVLGISTAAIFPIFNLRIFPLSVAIVALALCAVQFICGAQAAFYAEALPTPMRFTGSAIGYTGANLLFSAPTPFIASWILLSTGNNVFFISLYSLCLVAISGIALFFIPERHGQPLEQ